MPFLADINKVRHQEMDEEPTEANIVGKNMRGSLWDEGRMKEESESTALLEDLVSGAPIISMHNVESSGSAKSGGGLKKCVAIVTRELSNKFVKCLLRRVPVGMGEPVLVEQFVGNSRDRVFDFCFDTVVVPSTNKLIEVSLNIVEETAVERVDRKREKPVGGVNGSTNTHVFWEKMFFKCKSIEELFPRIDNLCTDVAPKSLNPLISGGRTNERSSWIRGAYEKHTGRQHSILRTTVNSNPVWRYLLK